MLWTGLGLAAVAAAGAYPPEHGQVCRGEGGCPPAQCFDAVCDGPGVCNYTRQGLDECCLTNDECCSIAQPGWTGICGKDCTCGFSPGGGQCTADADCEGFVSGLLCKQQGPCFYPYCVTPAGQCDCLDGTDLDLDNDTKTCPQDCDDLDGAVSALITCYRDGDTDGYVDCDAHNRTTECRELCIEPGRTCPPGWSDPTDENAQHKLRSDVDPDTGTPCANIDISAGQCDCCDADPAAYPESTHAANGLNGCGQPDYNCNGVPERLACCTSGYPHPETDRVLWHAPGCAAEPEPQSPSGVCGSCITEGLNDPMLQRGWACEEECPPEQFVALAGAGDDEIGALLAHIECPTSCGGECDCVPADPGTAGPALGRCGKWVHECIGIRTEGQDVTLYGESEDCCVAAIL